MNINVHDVKSIGITPVNSDGGTNWVSIVIKSKDGKREEICFFSDNIEALQIKHIDNSWSQ